METKQKTTEQRTIKQNSALHLYFTFLADELNNAGYDMRRTLKEGVDIPWNTQNIKDYLWKPVQESLLGKKSTTELTTTEIDKIVDILTRHLAKFGVSVEFPNEDR